MKNHKLKLIFLAVTIGLAACEQRPAQPVGYQQPMYQQPQQPVIVQQQQDNTGAMLTGAVLGAATMHMINQSGENRESHPPSYYERLKTETVSVPPAAKAQQSAAPASVQTPAPAAAPVQPQQPKPAAGYASVYKAPEPPKPAAPSYANTYKAPVAQAPVSKPAAPSYASAYKPSSSTTSSYSSSYRPSSTSSSSGRK